jgi:hypothetical protein
LDGDGREREYGDVRAERDGGFGGGASRQSDDFK